jgi:hypothetical protein
MACCRTPAVFLHGWTGARFGFLQCFVRMRVKNLSVERTTAARFALGDGTAGL